MSKKGKKYKGLIVQENKDGTATVDLNRVLWVIGVEFAAMADGDDSTLGMRVIGHTRRNHTDQEVVMMMPMINALIFAAHLVEILDQKGVPVGHLMDKESREELVNKVRHAMKHH